MLAGLVWGFFNRTAARVATVGTVIPLGIAVRLAGEKFEAGNCFQLAVHGHRQPSDCHEDDQNVS